MKSQEKKIISGTATIMILVAVMLLLMSVGVMAGNLEPDDPPPVTGSGTMHTLEDIYTEIQTLKIIQTDLQVMSGNSFMYR